MDLSKFDMLLAFIQSNDADAIERRDWPWMGVVGVDDDHGLKLVLNPMECHLLPNHISEIMMAGWGVLWDVREPVARAKWLERMYIWSRNNRRPPGVADILRASKVEISLHGIRHG